jgi:hypothetical protein
MVQNHSYERDQHGRFRCPKLPSSPVLESPVSGPSDRRQATSRPPRARNRRIDGYRSKPQPCRPQRNVMDRTRALLPGLMCGHSSLVKTLRLPHALHSIPTVTPEMRRTISGDFPADRMCGQSSSGVSGTLAGLNQVCGRPRRSDSNSTVSSARSRLMRPDLTRCRTLALELSDGAASWLICIRCWVASF